MKNRNVLNMSCYSFKSNVDCLYFIVGATFSVVPAAVVSTLMFPESHVAWI